MSAQRRWILVTLTALLGAALLHVWVRMQVIAVGYDLSRETRLRHGLVELQNRLNLELRTRLDLTNIERVARDELGLVSPDAGQLRALTVPARLLPRAAADSPASMVARD